MARQHENSQLAGHNRRWWQVMGSNHRRLSRRFYSPILLFESYVANLRLYVPTRDWVRRRPLCVRALGAGREATHGRARTAASGGRAFTPPIRAFLPFDLRCSSCLLAVAVFLAAGFRLGVPSAEGVGDELVGGVGLPFDAVRVELQCA